MRVEKIITYCPYILITFPWLYTFIFSFNIDGNKVYHVWPVKKKKNTEILQLFIRNYKN